MKKEKGISGVREHLLRQPAPFIVMFGQQFKTVRATSRSFRQPGSRQRRIPSSRSRFALPLREGRSATQIIYDDRQGLPKGGRGWAPALNLQSLKQADPGIRQLGQLMIQLSTTGEQAGCLDQRHVPGLLVVKRRPYRLLPCIGSCCVTLQFVQWVDHS